MIKDLPLNELILRRYEKPYQLEERELVKKICLSLGLLQLGDSRDIIVDILMILNKAAKEKQELTSDEIKGRVVSEREKRRLELKGIADSNIRRQLKRLRDSMIIEKRTNSYRMTEFASLSEIFEQKIEKFLLPQMIERIKEYLSELDRK
ncbi:hypothetical protein HZA33_02445 [Candidatus Pacearchaeota archaeon]|nr:hypothetical protein [Candidatus Pacearchaeota archaeon]